jgi:hypothetical protein
MRVREMENNAGAKAQITILSTDDCGRFYAIVGLWNPKSYFVQATEVAGYD